MKKNSDVIDRMERDALYTYLELMNISGNVPEKQTYEGILKIKNAEALDELISLMELEISNHEKDLEKEQNIKHTVKPSLIQRILNAVKNSYL